jgi:hypothetical protein
MKVSAYLKNTGETPAMNFTAFIRTDIRRFSYEVFPCEDISEKSLLTLGPQIEFPFEGSFGPQPQAVADLIVG